MGLHEILGILFIHWIADFILQTDKQAKNKSTDFFYLIDHTFMYTIVFMFFGLFVCCPYFPHWFTVSQVLLFGLITFVCHTITDYFTSRLNSRLWREGKVHNFFVSVGFDQWLHYVQLFTTYWFLTK